MANIRFKRGSRSAINAAAAASGLAAGEPYLITDESRIAVGTAANTYKAFVRQDDAIAAPEIHAATSKTTPVDADELGIVDSAASNVLKKLTFANLAAWVRGIALTGLSTATNAVITASDTVLGALGKLQKQISDHLAKTTGAHAASAVSNTPAGNIAATTVQAAINELDSEKVGKTGAQTMAGDLSVPSLNGGQLAGLRNKADNGGFAVNQRGYVSGAATTASQFVFDRWRVTGTGGVTYSITANKVTVTIPSGQTLQQVISGENLQSGTYVLSWDGTAQGRIAGGSYGASGAVTASITGGTNTTIEFNAGTVETVQIERGTVSTPFEARGTALDLLICQQYYYRTFVASAGSGSHGGIAVTTSAVSAPLRLLGMRATPTISVLNNNVANQVRNIATGATVSVGPVTIVVGASLNGFSTLVFTNAVLTVGQFYDFDVIAAADI